MRYPNQTRGVGRLGNRAGAHVTGRRGLSMREHSRREAGDLCMWRPHDSVPRVRSLALVPATSVAERRYRRMATTAGLTYALLSFPTGCGMRRSAGRFGGRETTTERPATRFADGPSFSRATWRTTLVNEREMWPAYLTRLATQASIVSIWHRHRLRLHPASDRRLFSVTYPFLYAVPGYGYAFRSLPDAKGTASRHAGDSSARRRGARHALSARAFGCMLRMDR